ncbi:MAG TPA: hypothetical protein VFE32_13085 [Puia sp.]|jgi:hypothetical protein|nr:hypothetical protein [Puia sp.]
MEQNLELIFKSDIDDFDSEMKGYRNDVLVRLPNGEIYEIFFYDIVRLQQDMGDAIYLSQPGLIILNAVNKETIGYAVKDLWKRGYFEHLKPRLSISEKHFDENI